jgi:hypothetical protein
VLTVKSVSWATCGASRPSRSSGAPECLLRLSRQFAASGTNAAGACFIFSGRGVECSGGKADESAVGRKPKSAVAIRRPQAQRRGSLRLGCVPHWPPFQSEERSDEVSIV